MDARALEDLGLYDPRAPDAAERLALLEYLVEQGLTADEMLAAQAEGRLTSLGADPVIRLPGEVFTAAEMSARTGIPLDLGIRIWRAAGFPDPGDAPIYTEADAAAVAGVAAAIELFGEQAALQFVRLMGSSLSRMADGMLTMFEANVGTRMAADDAPAVEIARAGASAAQLIPAINAGVDALLRHHLNAARRRRWASSIGRTTTIVRLAVGFADLVGYTAWSAQRAADEVTAAIARFEAVASELASDEGGRVVKTIGDEVMFIAADPAAGCRIARALVEAFAEHPSVPPLRAGLAFGEVIPQDGDYFGETVNRAARAVKLADESEVLVDEAITGAVEAAFEPLGPRTLKGFDEPVELARLVKA
jgi:class 3 adenylate cyclase